MEASLAAYGGSLVKVGTGTLTIDGAGTYTGGTTVSDGALVVGDFANPTAALSGGGPISVGSGGTLGGYGSVTGAVTNSGVIAAGSATPGSQRLADRALSPSSAICSTRAPSSSLPERASAMCWRFAATMSAPAATMAINTFLGGDGSPSDRLVINGGARAATGDTPVHVTNVGGPGAETTGNGIQVVNAINGATTAPGAFALPAGELRAGAFDYDLFRGGVSRTAPMTGSCAPTSSRRRSCRRSRRQSCRRSCLHPLPFLRSLPTRRRTRCRPASSFRSSGPNSPPMAWCSLWRGNWGLPSSARSTTGSATPISRTALWRRPRPRRPGLTCRPGSRLPTKKAAAAPCPLFSPSVWGRFFGQTIHNHYQAFADPSANGDLGGFQGGIDLLRGSLIAGHYERAGLYGAYGDVHADVDGLVTNPAATAYILTHTGSMNLDAWSAGGYWTHTGPGGWYLDAVLQGTWYYGSASTQFARLNTDGTGFIASLESGYPYALPQLGPGFVLEPQGQILWQKVSFHHDYDGLGDVALGDTTGPSGRIGLRTKWTIVTGGGQVWQPYLRANLWRDWGAEANTVYSGTDIVPLVEFRSPCWSLAAA